MDIRKGMVEAYPRWLEKNEKSRQGRLVIAVTERIGKFLEFGGTGEEAFKIFLHPDKSKLPAGMRAYIALSVSRLHPRGYDVRFHWNRFYRGDLWAIRQEVSERREVYDPSR